MALIGETSLRLGVVV